MQLYLAECICVFSCFVCVVCFVSVFIRSADVCLCVFGCLYANSVLRFDKRKTFSITVASMTANQPSSLSLKFPPLCWHPFPLVFPTFPQIKLRDSVCVCVRVSCGCLSGHEMRQLDEIAMLESARAAPPFPRLFYFVRLSFLLHKKVFT